MSPDWPISTLGLDIGKEFPKPMTDEVVQAADAVITMGCGDACPIYPGKRYEDWDSDELRIGASTATTTTPCRDAAHTPGAVQRGAGRTPNSTIFWLSERLSGRRRAPRHGRLPDPDARVVASGRPGVASHRAYGRRARPGAPSPGGVPAQDSWQPRGRHRAPPPGGDRRTRRRLVQIRSGRSEVMRRLKTTHGRRAGPRPRGSCSAHRRPSASFWPGTSHSAPDVVARSS